MHIDGIYEGAAKMTDGTGSNYSNNGFRNYMNKSTTNYTYNAKGNLIAQPTAELRKPAPKLVDSL